MIRGAWRGDFIKDKLAKLMLEIKQQTALIDKLRKNQRRKAQ